MCDPEVGTRNYDIWAELEGSRRAAAPLMEWLSCRKRFFRSLPSPPTPVISQMVAGLTLICEPQRDVD